jgi:hypothetical protein
VKLLSERVRQTFPGMDRKNKNFDGAGSRGFENRMGFWRPLLALTGLTGLLVFQSWAYFNRLPLSLGPRVILQPWLLQHGSILYENIIDIHSPLMEMILTALLPLVPDGLQLAKLVLVSLISITTLFVFVTGWRKTGWLGGLWAACFFVVWSYSMGFGKLWYETFLAPFFLFWLFVFKAPAAPVPVDSLITPDGEKGIIGDPKLESTYSFLTLVIIGLLGGVSVLIKQQAAFVFVAFISWRLFTNWYSHAPVSYILRELLLLGLAAIAPVLIYLVYQYAQAGTLSGFLYWMIGYQLTGVYTPYTSQPPTIIQIKTIASACLLIPAAIFCVLDMKRKGDNSWLTLAWGLLLLATGSVTAYPRFEFFHLQPILPVLAVVSSITLVHALRSQISGRYFTLGMVVALSAFWLITEGSNYRTVVEADPPSQIYEYSGLLPLAQKIKGITGPTGCVYIFPDIEAVANLYYLLDCSPPKFWIFHYPWYMLDWVRARIMQTLEEDPPDWVVYFPDRYGTEKSFPEAKRYLESHYSQVATFHWEHEKVRLLKRSSEPPPSNENQ